MAGHTPGPWKYEDTTSITATAVDLTLYGPAKKYLGNLAECSDNPDLHDRGWLPLKEGIANARLITAAPDLLETLQTIVDGLGEFLKPAELDKAIAVLKKARG
jgi:hypothetical protein